MSIVKDFAGRTRSRLAEARAVLNKLRAAHKEAVKQLAKINKPHTSDVDRVSERLGQLADDISVELPEAASDTDVDRAHVIQEQIHAVANDVEEVSLAGYMVEDFAEQLNEAINEFYAHLKEAETQLGKVERLSTKIGV